jgi:outer membrane receptor protein involved in Fe transport
MKAIRYAGEIIYTEQEKFSATAGFNFVKYIEQETYDKAYGLIPIEFKAGVRVQAIKDLWIKSDMSIWQGPQYMRMDATRSSGQLKGSIDLNAGVEFRITKNLNVWAQFNNIFNREYQLYNQYPSYGFNLLGGITFAFDQKTK